MLNRTHLLISCNTRLTAIFQDNLEIIKATYLLTYLLTYLTRVSQYRSATVLNLIDARMMEAMPTARTTRRAKFQSNRRHQQTNIQFFYRPDALPVTQPTVP